jgi:diguanylate cyclase (GGDEF)-like protein/PAS domain S-box-containing protein
LTGVIRLLYAEDNALDADLTRVFFEQSAPDILLQVVESGATCLSHLTSHTYDALLLDNRLPDMDGLAVLERIRALGLTLPVVMVTGMGDDETVAQALRAGAADYVAKSGDYLNGLPTLLRNLLSGRRKRARIEGADAARTQHILYIEPNVMDAELTVHHFASHAPQLQLQVLSSCADALRLLAGPHHIDLILSDLRVPGMDALELVHEINQRQIDLPVIVITGRGDEATAVAVLRLGASDYLVKRDNYLVQLPHAIEHALMRYRLEKTSLRLYTELETLNNTLEAQVAERTAQLHQAQAQLKATFDAIPDLIWQKNRAGNYLACNPAMARLTGLSPNDLIGRMDDGVFSPPVAQALREHDLAVIESGQPVAREHWLTSAETGQRILFDVANTPVFDPQHHLTGVLAVARDITERKAAQEKIRRMSQLYAALSQCNQAIVRCTTQDELFKQVCLDCVRFGGLKMAWIGLADPPNQRVDVVAGYGEGSEGYLRNIAISLDPTSPRSGGPVGLAVQTGEPVWCQDYANDPRMAPWRESGMQYGWASCAALPLFRLGNAVGAFNVYADEVHAFDDATCRLLIEMAGDISFALNNFDRDAARVRAEDALRLTRISVEAASEALFWVTPDARIVDVNEAACRSLGYERHALLNMGMPAVTVNGDLSQWRAHFDKVRRVGSLTYETSYITRDGRTFPVEVVANYVKFGADERICAFVRDISEHKAREARIQQLAHFDALTGLPNRVLLNDRITHALSMAQRSQTPLAVLLLDLDHFKYINDTLGHRIGDLLLIELAQRLSLAVREEDTVSRLGGDEFLLLLPGNNATAAAHVAEKLLSLLARPCQLEQNELIVTPSIGIAMYPGDGTDFDTLSKCADVAMYRAKKEGRNNFRFFTPEMQALSARTLLLENALRFALSRDQFSLKYQPQLSLATGAIVGVEALLRWEHPEIGPVAPMEFIPIAESSGQIIDIGEWVLRQAIAQIRRWMDDGLPPLTMSVNLSAVQFRHPQFPELVSQLLGEARVPAHLLELELTEGVAMENALTAIGVMDDLQARGVSLAIDDFGTGYSSLAYLKRFKVSRLKIDQSFVRDIALDADDRAIVVAVITLAQSLGIQTIAEGVETQEQCDFLRQEGCGQIQGHLLSEPLSADEARALFKRHQAW